MQSEDYLAAIAPTITRLKEALGDDVREVLQAADLAGIVEEEQPTPAVHVLYDGDQLGEAQGSGAIQAVDQRFMFIVVVDNIRQGDGGETARSEAGPIISKVLKAVAGWKATSDHGAYKRVPGMRPGYTDRHAYFPFVFTARVTTR